VAFVRQSRPFFLWVISKGPPEFGTRAGRFPKPKTPIGLYALWVRGLQTMKVSGDSTLKRNEWSPLLSCPIQIVWDPTTTTTISSRRRNFQGMTHDIT
jgi:hypothetical protein